MPLTQVKPSSIRLYWALIVPNSLPQSPPAPPEVELATIELFKLVVPTPLKMPPARVLVVVLLLMVELFIVTVPVLAKTPPPPLTPAELPLIVELFIVATRAFS